MLRIYEPPTLLNYLMAFIPCLIVLFNSFFAMVYSYYAWGTYEATVVSTVLSGFMFITEIVAMIYKQHYEFEKIQTLLELIARFNFFQLVFVSASISYVKTMGADGYTTYFTLLYLTTIPMFCLSSIPFVCGLFRITEREYRVI